MTTTYETRDGDVLDYICWRHYRRQSGAVEAVLEANPGLAEHGAVLPAGITIMLPELPAPEATDVVRIWD